MKRVLIIGCPGSGKSTFGRGLAAASGLPLHYLDMIWHKPDRTTVSTDEFDRSLSALLATDRWIIDGNYMRTIGLRLGHCDTVFFFDLPTDVCLQGATARIGKPRPDMPWTETELDEEFRQWILDFGIHTRPEIIKELEAHPGLDIYTFRSRDEADAFLRSLDTFRTPATEQ